MRNSGFICTLLFTTFCIGLHSQVQAQDFNTRAWYGAQSVNGAFGPAAVPRVHPAYRAPANYAARPASYRVERDPRYMGSLPASRPVGYRSQTALRPHARPAPIYRGQSADYAPVLPSAYRAKPYVAPGYAAQPNPGLRYQVPDGYYRGDGLFGKDTVYAENQPVRNFFRFLAP